MGSACTLLWSTMTLNSTLSGAGRMILTTIGASHSVRFLILRTEGQLLIARFSVAPSEDMNTPLADRNLVCLMLRVDDNAVGALGRRVVHLKVSLRTNLMDQSVELDVSDPSFLIRGPSWARGE